MYVEHFNCCYLCTVVAVVGVFFPPFIEGFCWTEILWLTYES